MAEVIALKTGTDTTNPIRSLPKIHLVGLYVAENKLLLIKRYNYAMLYLPGGSADLAPNWEDQLKIETEQLPRFVYEKSGFVLSPVTPVVMLSKLSKDMPIKVLFLQAKSNVPDPQWIRNEIYDALWLPLDQVEDHPHVTDSVKEIIRFYKNNEKKIVNQPWRLNKPIDVITLQ